MSMHSSQTALNISIAILSLLVFCFESSAQDVIIKQDATEIQAKVEEVSFESIKYRRFSNPQGPLYTISPSDVFMIKYENGDRLLMSDFLTKAMSSHQDASVESDIKVIEQTIQKNQKKEIHKRHIEITPSIGIGYNVGYTKNFSSSGFCYGPEAKIEIFPNLKTPYGISVGVGYQRSKMKSIIENKYSIEDISVGQLTINPMFVASNHFGSKLWGFIFRAGLVFAMPMHARYSGTDMMDGMRLALGFGTEAGVSYGIFSLTLNYYHYLRGMFDVKYKSAYNQLALHFCVRF